MSGWRCFIFMGLILLTSSVSAVSREPEKITWLINDAPPFFIVSGPHQDTGICDTTLTYLEKALPDIQHERIRLPHTRIGKVLDEGMKACFPCMIKRSAATSRARFSNATVVYPPHVLVTSHHKSGDARFIGKDEVTLSQLLDDKSLIFAKHADRLFGSHVDAVLSTSGDKKRRIILRNEGKSTTSVLRLLQIGRADFTIEYPAIVNYFNASNQPQLIQWTMTENQYQPVVGAVGCAASAPDDFAVSALNAINRALRNIMQQEKYQQEVSRWFNVDQQYQDWFSELVVAAPQ